MNTLLTKYKKIALSDNFNMPAWPAGRRFSVVRKVFYTFPHHKTLIAFLILVGLSACNKPSYPTGKIEESVLKLCKNEYKLDNVKIKILGSTLGVYIPVEGLIDPDLKLNEKAGKKIEDVALSIHRVVTSTDMPLKFYILTARDTKTTGAEFILTGFVYDVIRVRLFDISRGEYFQRILRDFRFNPAMAGEQKVKELFNALNQNTPIAESLKPIFYPIYAIGKKDSQKIEITSIESKELSDRESLFYVKTTEEYKASPEFEAYLTVFPPGFKNEYLILVDMSSFINPVKEVVSKYFYSNNEIRERKLKDTFEQYNDFGIIGVDGFPKKDLDLGWFLSQQISRRIKSIFEEDRKLKNDFKVISSQGEIRDKIFWFKFNITSNHNQVADKKIIFSRIIKMTADVLHLYAFEEYKGVEFINFTENEKKIYLSKEDLERFRKDEIKIDPLL
ncbi:MAG: hypothetical protein AUJ70_00415 [Candidatus Omnitrophica bacterium CG1_02_40_15]|nr:MAG: hypothetical protein AUJ70_00415 [Candidatus Omnitrophica bacterium CG1_02_40_15]